MENDKRKGIKKTGRIAVASALAVAVACVPVFAANAPQGSAGTQDGLTAMQSAPAQMQQAPFGGGQAFAMPSDMNGSMPQFDGEMPEGLPEFNGEKPEGLPEFDGEKPEGLPEFNGEMPEGMPEFDGEMPEGMPGIGGPAGGMLNVQAIEESIAALDDEDLQADLTDLLADYTAARDAVKAAFDDEDADVDALMEVEKAAKDALSAALEDAGIEAAVDEMNGPAPDGSGMTAPVDEDGAQDKAAPADDENDKMAGNDPLTRMINKFVEWLRVFFTSDAK